VKAVTEADAIRARRVLAEVQTWHEARGRACDAACGPADGSIARFLDRADWFDRHPVDLFEDWRLFEARAEARRFAKPLSLAVPRAGRKPLRAERPPVIAADRQMEIALAALAAQEAAAAARKEAA
jgi:hypothetical protein